MGGESASLNAIQPTQSVRPPAPPSAPRAWSSVAVRASGQLVGKDAHQPTRHDVADNHLDHRQYRCRHRCRHHIAITRGGQRDDAIVPASLVDRGRDWWSNLAVASWLDTFGPCVGWVFDSTHRRGGGYLETRPGSGFHRAMPCIRVTSVCPAQNGPMKVALPVFGTLCKSPAAQKRSQRVSSRADERITRVQVHWTNRVSRQIKTMERAERMHERERSDYQLDQAALTHITESVAAYLTGSDTSVPGSGQEPE
jgi:hypothetical protein